MQNEQGEEKAQELEMDEATAQADAAQQAETTTEEPQLDEKETLRIELAEAKDKYIRLYSEFENFRRRTAKERIELIGTASKDLMESLVPVLDDFERAIRALEENPEGAPSKEGTELIYTKYRKVLEGKGLKNMEVKKGDDFNDEYHEAITQVPAGAELAGKVVDVVENGYFLNDKVVRFAKVVTGAKA